MPAQQMLEVVIGLAFLYLSLSLLCSGLNELVARVFGLRAKVLKICIQNMLRDTPASASGSAKPIVEGAIALRQLIAGKSPVVSSLADDFFRHQLIQATKTASGWFGGIGDPSYISSHTFATALWDLVASKKAAAPPATSVGAMITTAALSAPVKEALVALASRAGSSGTSVQVEIERWFDDTMERLSGWYKRLSNTVMVVVALVVCALLNADTLDVAKTLWNNGPLRQEIVATAQAYMSSTPDMAAAAKRTVEENTKQLQVFPLGWKPGDCAPCRLPLKVAGILLSAFLVSLGGPFWFDLLNKALQLRNTGPKPAVPTP